MFPERKEKTPELEKLVVEKLALVQSREPEVDKLKVPVPMTVTPREVKG